MEARTVLCCSKGPKKKIHVLLSFTKFASHIQTELLNVKVSYEEKRRAKRLAVQGKRRGLGRNGNLSAPSQDNHSESEPESFVSGKGSKWSILCLAEH